MIPSLSSYGNDVVMQTYILNIYFLYFTAFDASNAITYTTCNDGYAVFGQSSSSRDFPRASYTPMCAYAVNYIFQKHRKRVATPNQNTRTLSTKSTSTSESTASVKDPKPVSTPTTHSSTPTESVKPAITSSTPTESVKPATPSSTSTASLKPATPSSTYTEPVKPSLEARATIQPVAPLPSTSCSSNSNHQHDTASSSTNNQTTTGQEESDALQLSYEEAIRTQNSEAVNIYLEIIKMTSITLKSYTKLFNLIHKSGCCPKFREQSYVIAIHKSGDK